MLASNQVEFFFFFFVWVDAPMYSILIVVEHEQIIRKET